MFTSGSVSSVSQPCCKELIQGRAGAKDCSQEYEIQNLSWKDILKARLINQAKASWLYSYR